MLKVLFLLFPTLNAESVIPAVSDKHTGGEPGFKPVLREKLKLLTPRGEKRRGSNDAQR